MSALLSLRRYWQAVAIAALVTFLVGACHQRDEGLKREGAMRVQLAALEQKHTRDSATAVRLDTIVRTDTQRLRKVLTTYDTVRSTLNITDTVAVRAFVLSADSTIGQCRVTVGHLLTSCAAKDTVIADLRGLLKIKTEALASAGLSWKEKLLYGLAGAAVNEAVHRVPRH